MKTSLVIAFVAVFSFSCHAAASEDPASEGIDDVTTYLAEAREEVELIKTLRKYETGDNEGWETSLKDEYAAAAKQVEGNEAATKALRAHWIKLHQCLSPSLKIRDIDQCNYELSGLSAALEIDAGL